MDKIYRLPARPEAKEANVVKGDKYRITVLTEGLLAWSTAKTASLRTGLRRRC